MSALLIRIAVSALLLTLAAMAAERSLRDARLPVRAVWVGALLGTVVVTLLLASGAALPLSIAVPIGEPVVTDGALALDSAAPVASSEGVLVLVWGMLTTLLLVAVGATARLQTRHLREGRSRRIDGVDVVVTHRIGPAVAGVFRPRIVVPDWVLELPRQQRDLIVRHEAEHATARDHTLWVGALLLCCLLPWNPLLWYQLHRLRMAIEIDCDARVLRREAGAFGAYGLLLIHVAERMARGTPLATALVHPRSFLERRIQMIVQHTRRPLHAAAWALGAGLLVVGACADAEPTTPELGPQNSTLESAGIVRPLEGEPTATRWVATREAAEEAWAERTGDPEGTFKVQLSDDAATSPDPAPGTTGLVRFRATVDPEGRTTDIEFEPGTSADLEQRADLERRALHALERVRFRSPADDNDEPVEGVITLP